MNKEKIITYILAAIFIIAAAIHGLSDSSSSSERKWSDLSEVEKANARWAYEVQQSLND